MKGRDQSRPYAIAWTGHRPYYFRDPRTARRAVDHTARSLQREFGTELLFLTGGQRGVDLWAAEAGLALDVPVHVILPLSIEAFTTAWRRPDVERLERILADATAEETVTPAGSGEAAYQERNRRLATDADLLVAVWTGVEQGGTWQTIQFARALGRPIREVHLAGSGRVQRPELRGL